jgi:hypothetical protein
MEGVSAFNQQIAERLCESAELLKEQRTNLFRVAAYRHGAETAAGLNEHVARS